MVIHSEPVQNDNYTMRMISGNKIPGLLGFQEKWVNGLSFYYYDITSKQPLNRLTEHKKMTRAEIHTLISDLVLVLRQMERYLLDEQRICLQPEYIYMEPETRHGSFCLIPGYQSDFTREFLELAQYILDHVDHSDGEAVVLAFSVFRESRKENFGVEDIEKCIGTGSQTTELAEVQVQKFEETSEKIEQDVYALEHGIPMEPNEGIIGPEKAGVLCVVVVLGMIAFPSIGVALFGVHVLLRWKWVFFALEIFFAVAGIIIYYFLKVKESGEKDVEVSPELEIGELIWEMDEEVKREETMQSFNRLELEQEDNMQTVLLVSQREILQKR